MKEERMKEERMKEERMKGERMKGERMKEERMKEERMKREGIKGGWLVILWLFLFSLISFYFCHSLKIKTVEMCTIFVWTLLMVFVSIFEFLLIFHHSYLSDKGEYYYKEKKCFWTEDGHSIKDIFSYTMYMDLYADYSYCDKRYCKRVKNDEGCRFVLSGEIIHGLFSGIMSFIILYLFFSSGSFDSKIREKSIYLSAIVFSSIQFAIIVWYCTTIWFETFFVKNDQVWWFPFFWNVPWFILPGFIIYFSFKKLLYNV